MRIGGVLKGAAMRGTLAYTHILYAAACRIDGTGELSLH